MSNSITITGTVSDSNGQTASFSASASLDQVTVTSATITPQIAPPGTTRTLTVVGNSSSNSPLTFATTVGTPFTFTPVANPPPGEMQWTFVY